MKKINGISPVLIAIAALSLMLSGCAMLGGNDAGYEVAYVGHDNLGNEYVISYGADGVVVDIETVVGGNAYEVSEDGFAITTADGQTLIIKKVE